jgi:putative transposase
MHFSRSPTSFNGRFRDECLNQHWFTSLGEARRIVDAWRLDYNRARPHSALGYVTPDQFAQEARAATAVAALSSPVGLR